MCVGCVIMIGFLHYIPLTNTYIPFPEVSDPAGDDARNVVSDGEEKDVCNKDAVKRRGMKVVVNNWLLLCKDGVIVWLPNAAVVE